MGSWSQNKILYQSTKMSIIALARYSHIALDITLSGNSMLRKHMGSLSQDNILHLTTNEATVAYLVFYLPE